MSDCTLSVLFAQANGTPMCYLAHSLSSGERKGNSQNSSLSLPKGEVWVQAQWERGVVRKLCSSPADLR